MERSVEPGGPGPFVDPECADGWRRFLARRPDGTWPQLSPDTLGELRRLHEPTREESVDPRTFLSSEFVVPREPEGAVPLTVVAPRAATGGAAALLHLHGGGTVFGNRFSDIGRVLDWARVVPIEVVSVEYRLAPESPYPAALDDAWAALGWLAARPHAGAGTGRAILVGESAGGGLAAALALRARDAGLDCVAGALLMCPMLDDRRGGDLTAAPAAGPWSDASNRTAWDMYLAGRRGADDVPAYAAPARARDLGGLPPLYLDVGSADVLREEVVDFSARAWRSGGDVELHVWPGGFHGFDEVAPDARVSAEARRARVSWLRRLLSDP